MSIHFQTLRKKDKPKKNCVARIIFLKSVKLVRHIPFLNATKLKLFYYISKDLCNGVYYACTINSPTSSVLDTFYSTFMNDHNIVYIQMRDYNEHDLME